MFDRIAFVPYSPCTEKLAHRFGSVTKIHQADSGTHVVWLKQNRHHSKKKTDIWPQWSSTSFPWALCTDRHQKGGGVTSVMGDTNGLWHSWGDTVTHQWAGGGDKSGPYQCKSNGLDISQQCETTSAKSPAWNIFLVSQILAILWTIVSSLKLSKN